MHAYTNTGHSLGDSDSVSMLRAVAIGGAEWLVDGHWETAPSAPIVALSGGWDGHQRDSVRDSWAWRIQQGNRGDDGLVVTVATEVIKEKEKRVRGGWKKW